VHLVGFTIEMFVPTLFVSEVLFVTVSTVCVIIPGCVYNEKLLLFMS
jgi:hypothetical protein